MSDSLAFTLGALIGAVAVGHLVLIAVVLETVHAAGLEPAGPAISQPLTAKAGH